MARRLHGFFAIILFLSIFSGVAHEMTHVHHLGDNCQICTLTHSPALPIDAPVLTFVDLPHESFNQLYLDNSKPLYIQSRSRSPPLS